MDKTICLDQNYSTTCLLTKENPILEQRPEYKLEPKLLLTPNPERKGEGGLRTKGLFKRSLENKPLISIVTVVYNGEKHLEQTINSVLDQSYDNVEYVIIDGGSIDGTLDIIKKYADMIDYWVSEPDEGISDAFNKGIQLTTGKIIGLLNADDWYEDECTSYIVKNFNKGNILHSKLNYWTDGQIEFVSTPEQTNLEREMSISHPTVFIKRTVYETIGLFQTSYKLAMDYEILLRAYRQNISFYYIDHPLANMRNDGVSAQYWVKATLEVERAKISHGISRYKTYYHFFTHAIWPHSKVIIFQFIQKSKFSVILRSYRFAKRKIFKVLGK